MLKALVITGVPGFPENFRVEFGTVSCIVGPNASGKTLLLSLVSALITGSSKHLYGPLLNAKITGEFESSAGKDSTSLRMDFSTARRPKIWVQDRPYSEIPRSLFGHKLLSFSALMRAIGHRDLISALHHALTGNKQAPRIDQVNRMAEILDRYSPMVSNAVGQVVLSPTGEFLWNSGGRSVSFRDVASAGERSLLAFQLILASAIDVSYTEPTILLLDEPLGMVDDRRASDALLSLSSILPPTLQVVITSSHEDLPNMIQADAVIRLQPMHLDMPPVATTTYRPKHAVTVIQEALESYGNGQEDGFIDFVLRPGLIALGAENVHRIRNHGPGEFGVDVGPFSYPGPFGRRLLVGVQAKSGKVHATSSRGQGAVETLISEVRKALDKRFLDPNMNRYRRLDYVIAAVSGYLTPDAQELFYDAFEGDHRVILWDAAKMAEEFWKVKFRPSRAKS